MSTKPILVGDTIKDLYPYPEVGNTGTPPLPYDQSKPQKNWRRALKPGEDKGAKLSYTYLSDQNKVTFATNTITLGEADAINMPPSGYIYPPGVPVNETSVPIPVDVTMLPPGDVLTPSHNPFQPLPIIAAGGQLSDHQMISQGFGLLHRIAAKLGA